MCDWADSIGVESVWLSEHHGDSAGYTSAPLTLAAGVLARTKNLAVSVAAVLAPLHDPVRLAEQIATVGCLAPARLAVTLGAGYRKAEFDMAGVDRSARGRLVEETIEVLVNAAAGEPFMWRGREVLIVPTAPDPGGVRLLLGGKSAVAARRAARYRLPFAPGNREPGLVEAYRDECIRCGYDGEVDLGAISQSVATILVTDDPETAWSDTIAPLAAYDAETYASWQDDKVHSGWAVFEMADRDVLRTRYHVVTPAECLALAEEHGFVVLHPLLGGVPLDMAWEGLRLFEREVVPKLR